MKRTIVKPLVLAFCLAALPACQAIKNFNFDFLKSSGGPGHVNELVSAIELVYVDSEVAKERAHGAVNALRAIVASDFQGDAVSAYAEYMTAIENSEEQAEKLRDSIEEMKDSSDPVFEQWAEDLKDINSVELRQRSRNRLMETRERYHAIVAAAEPALVSYDAVNHSLRDHALFLGNALNPVAVSEIQGEARALAKRVTELDSEFDACLKAARAYVESAALPVSAAQPLEGPPAPAFSQGETGRRATSMNVSGSRNGEPKARSAGGK